LPYTGAYVPYLNIISELDLNPDPKNKTITFRLISNNYISYEVGISVYDGLLVYRSNLNTWK
jgi:hypothetical protein